MRPRNPTLFHFFRNSAFQIQNVELKKLRVSRSFLPYSIFCLSKTVCVMLTAKFNPASIITAMQVP